MMQDRNWRKTLIAAGIFGISMGFLEAAVVVYLRAQYYPEGFTFPLKIFPPNILVIEVIREAATILMLIAVGWLAGGNFLTRFAYFVFTFSVWDIFYYVFLKWTINWPQSLNDWDILFLVPLPWVAPVLAPVIVSISLIGASIIVLYRHSIGIPVKIPIFRWLLIILGGVIIIISFLLNSGAVMNNFPLGTYNWYIFVTGLVISLIAFSSALKR
ncbi:MAG: hypothetical protein ACHQQQ_11055 [Bacteroidota bacterium]